MALNRATLSGRLTKDPELRYTGNGTPVSTFTLAVDRNYQGSQGEKLTDFIPIVVWGQQGEACAQYLKKGREAIVDGRIEIRTYENKEGRQVYVTEIIANYVTFVGGSGNGNSGNNNSPSNDPFAGSRPFTGDNPFL